MTDFELAIKLLPYLSAHGGISVDEVAQEFGVTARKVLQVLKLLPYTGRGQFGGELVDINVTDDGAIYVHDAQSLDAPVRLNGKQAFAILAGLTYLQNIPAFSDRDEVSALIEKISNAIDVEVPAIAVAADARQIKSIEILKRAIRERESVQIDYSSASSQNSPSRVIDPMSLFVAEDRTYINAWCHEVESIRSFRVDRIAHLELTGDKFEPHDVVQDNITGTSAKLLVAPDALSEFDALDINSSQQQPDGRFLIELTVANVEWLIRMTLAQGGDVEIVEPSTARDEIIKRAQACSAWS